MNSNRGLFIEQNGKFVSVSRIYPFAKPLDTLSYIHAAFVYDTKRNFFWIGTTTGSYCLDLANQKLFSATNNPLKIPFLTKDVISSITLDADGNLWYSNSTQASLNHYSFNTLALRHITHINNNPTWNLGGGCNTLFFDTQGRLWISTWLYSAFIRYPNGRFEEIPYSRDLPHSIGYGFFNDAFQDQYGNVWLATINGLSRLDAEKFVETIVQAPSYRFYLTTGFANINAMQTEGDYSWWLGKMEGLVKYDLQTKKFERFIVSQKYLPANEIFDLKWINGELWCTTINGIQIFNTKTSRFRSFDGYTKDKKNGKGLVQWFLQDKEGWIWLSIWKQGIYRYHSTTGRSESIGPEHIESGKGLHVTSSSYGFEDSDGKVWIATAEYGIRIFDRARQRFVEPASAHLQTLRVSSIAEDARKNIWLATTTNGIIKCNAAGGVIDSIDRKNGLPLNYFIDLTFDASGRLWTASRENLLCVSTDTKEVTKVDLPINFSFNDHWNSLLKQGNRLFATMLDNVVVMNTDNYQKLPQNIKPLISGFYLSGKASSFSESGIMLKHDQNFFSFDFASPFHKEAGAMQYSYKLEGFDEDWVNSGRRLTAAYTNVPHGQYRFLVRTTDEKGEWMKVFTAVPLIIHPPFWKTWWFISLISICAAVAIYMLYRVYNTQKRDKRMEGTIGYFANVHYGGKAINEICSDIAHNCASQLKLEDCVVYLMDEKQNLLFRKAAAGLSLVKDPEATKLTGIEPGRGIVGAAASTRKAVLSNDTAKDSRYQVGDELRLSELAVPIVHEGETIGVIDSEHSKKNFFHEYHVKTLSTIAAITASKIAEAKAEAAAKESEIQLLEIRKMYAESQLMALRAQMNPHFVFNCLNSIQECIVTQKYGEASLYLNKFGKLFRSVLNNSGKALVTLAEEIEVLDLYLTLEHMRFEESFTYTIYTDEELEADEILVPSMLLQPYVENALWHGLMHKEGRRTLFIGFLKKNEDVFECLIEDNGIGREKALALKEKQSKTKRHVSRGMTITKDRIELLQKQGHHAALQIIDKYGQCGEAEGTKVIIELSAYLR
jgi:ligand-binding sensor domain-containing protein/putative methionine-R-sulfoxide reductase with GAF domain